MTILSCRRTGVPPVSDLDARHGRLCMSVTIHAACLPRRSETKAGVLDCAQQAKRDAAFLVGRCRQTRCSRAASVPRLIKPNQAFPRLLKPFFKNPFFLPSLKSEPLNLCFGRLRSATEDPQGRRVPMSTKPSSIANYRPFNSPSPMSHRSEAKADGGDLSRLGSGERNLAKPKVAWRPSERARASQRRDEGELNTEIVRRCRQAPCSRAVSSIFNWREALHSRLFKPIQAPPPRTYKNSGKCLYKKL
jgi:hypothetical protein